MRRAIAFVIAGGLILALALDGGGYDLVTRQSWGLIVWALLALGFAVGVFPRGRPSRSALLAVGASLALAGLTALALTWTGSKEYTFDELARVLQYTGLLALAFAGLNRFTWRAAAAGLAVAALVVPLLSITARLAPHLITDHTASELHTDRLSYPFGYWNAVACWGGMAVAIGLAWSAHARHLATRALALAAVPPAGLAIYLSYSRGGAVAAGIAVVAAIAFGRNRWATAVHALVAGAGTGLAILAVRNAPQIADATGNDGAGTVVLVLAIAALSCAALAAITRLLGVDDVHVSRRTGRVAVAVAAIAAVALAVTVAREPITDGWDQFRDERATTVASDDPAARLTNLNGSRYDVWGSAVDAFESEPVHGIGPGTFEFYWARHGNNPEFLRDAHSVYLENLAELGIPGLLLILLLFGALLVGAIAVRPMLAKDSERGAHAGAVAAFCVFLFYAGVDWMWELEAVGALAVGGIAVAAAAGFVRARGRVGLPIPARVGLVLIAVLAAVIQVPSLVATDRVRDSADALAAGDAGGALELAEDAADAEPWATSPLVQQALAEEELGDFDAARSDLEDAVDREPDNWRHRFLLADLAARERNAPEVRRQLNEMRRLAPDSYFLLPGWPGRERIDKVLGLAAPPPVSPG